MALVLGLFIAICISATASQNIIQPVRCLKNGEYCQNHWECCSNSCMSYLYKCVKTHNPANMRPVWSASEPNPAASVSLSDLVDLIFGPNSQRTATRFDANENAAVLTKCKEVGSKCKQNNECCTNTCHGFLLQCVSN